MKNQVLVVGCGMMGPGIAVCAASAGHPTALTDRSLAYAQRGVVRARRLIEWLVSERLMEPERGLSACSMLSVVDNPSQCLPDTFLIIEAIPEDLPAKQQLFAELDLSTSPDVTIASNTSGLRISDIARSMRYPQRAITTHFWFPPHLIPLVEVVMGERTAVNVAVETRELLRRWGKAAVIVRRDMPGQLANRIFQAMIREAINVVEMGLASPEDVDTAIKMGLAMRLPAWGPLEHIDAVGLDLALSVQNAVLSSLSSDAKPAELLRSLVDQGLLGYKSGRGFYDWNRRDMSELARCRDGFIAASVKTLRAMNNDREADH